MEPKKFIDVSRGISNFISLPGLFANKCWKVRLQNGRNKDPRSLARRLKTQP